MSEINMTPLVDVMLVLVVIFKAPRFLTLTIDQAGQTFVNDQLLASVALSVALRQAAEQHSDTELRLRADATVPYGRVVEVMGLAHQAGLHRIGFVAEPVPSVK
jgi:biopolymer transport protein TolR